MASMTLTFEVPENKSFDQAAFKQKLSDLVQFMIQSLPDAEQDETDYIMSNPALVDAIKEGDKQIESGKVEVAKLEDLWN